MKCLVCRESIYTTEDTVYICTKDVNLRKVDTRKNVPKWCPNTEQNPLDIIRSC